MASAVALLQGKLAAVHGPDKRLTSKRPVRAKALQKGFSPHHLATPLPILRIVWFSLESIFKLITQGKEKMGRWTVEEPPHLINSQPLQSKYKVTEAEAVSC